MSEITKNEAVKPRERALRPEIIRVGPIDYTIVQMDPLEHARDGYLGRFNTKLAKIEIADGMPPSKEAEVVLHEALHACYDVSNLREAGELHEEKVVNALGYAILGLIRDNPDLVAYLGDAVSRR